MGRARRCRLRRVLAGRMRRSPTPRCSGARCSTRRPSATRSGCAPRTRGSRKGGVAHDGEVATRLGLPGIPAFAETIALATILELVRATGARVHLCRLSTRRRRSSWCARAKEEGLPVTCDVGVHHVHLCDMDIGYFDSHCRLEPPLRSQRDRDALRARRSPTARSTAVCSDHTPVDEDGKQLPFARGRARRDRARAAAAADAQVGRRRRSSSLAATLARITSEPARVLGVAVGPAGRRARRPTSCIFDPAAPFARRAGDAEEPGQEHAVPRLRARGPACAARSWPATWCTSHETLLSSPCCLCLGWLRLDVQPRGGYYKDDGPHESPPANLDRIADAVPTSEPLHKFANRPVQGARQGVRADDLGAAVPASAAWRAGTASATTARRLPAARSTTCTQMTAAHPTLPIPSYVRVTNAANGKSVVVRINDRGPFQSGRVIDLSYVAALQARLHPGRRGARSRSKHRARPDRGLIIRAFSATRCEFFLLSPC